MITSFFPGRIRLRAAVFKDDALCERAMCILRKSDAVKSVERNRATGSVLLRYDPGRVPAEKLAGLRGLLWRLACEAERYSGESRGRIEGLLGELEKAVSGWQDGGGEP